MQERHKASHRLLTLGAAFAALLAVWAIPGVPISAQGPPGTPQSPSRFGAIFVQCPGDTNGDSIPDAFNKDTNGDGVLDARWADENGDGVLDAPVRCMHLAAGDGIRRRWPTASRIYIFGFSDVTGTLPAAGRWTAGALAANFPAPTIRLKRRRRTST